MSKKGAKNPKWNRVRRTPISDAEKLRQDRNSSLGNNKMFLKSCEESNTKPTSRQISKYNNRKGRAYKYAHNLLPV